MNSISSTKAGGQLSLIILVRYQSGLKHISVTERLGMD